MIIMKMKAKKIDKMCNMRMTVIPIVDGAFGMVQLILERRLDELESRRKIQTIKTIQTIDRFESNEETWRHEKTCLHLDYSKTPSVNVDLIKRIITWAVPSVRYSRLFLKWTRQEFQQRNQKTRNLTT